MKNMKRINMTKPKKNHHHKTLRNVPDALWQACRIRAELEGAKGVGQWVIKVLKKEISLKKGE